MNNKTSYAVATIGIPEPERHVLKNIFKLSAYRAHSYTLTVGAEPSDILVVDADDPKAMAEWHSRRKQGLTNPTFGDNQKPHAPTIMVTKEKLSDSLPYYVRRPFVATRVLSVLDQVADRELDAKQERIIGVDAPPPAIMNTAKTVVSAVEERKIYTALVVDDSRPVRKQIELELKIFGIEVEAAESGEQALEMLKLRPYDLIFLDVVMPGIDGYHVCKTIKKDKAKKRIPVIMLTGRSSPFDRVRGALAGCDTYLTKPVKQESFQKVVKKYLR